jgi:disulfide bond formation protein DsbB
MKILELIQNSKPYKLVADNAHYEIWALAVASIFGSLYFSEIKELPPCNLCWWLRILLYPIAFIMTVAIIRKSFHNIYYEVLALAIPATLLSFYQSLLQWGIVKEAQVLCSSTAAVPCDKPDFLFLGFITIPFLGFLTSLAITALCLIAIHKQKD